MRARALIAVACLAALVAAGCGTADNEPIPEGEKLTIYVSGPLEGLNSEHGEAIRDGAKLALADAGGKAGDFELDTVFLDDTGGRGEAEGRDLVGWDPVVVADNARRAAEDVRAIAYIGEFESGATRTSLPITNQARMLAVTAGSTAVGLTRGAPGTGPNEPERYYPTGDRNFGRVVPADDVQAAAAAAWAKRDGARRVAVVTDGEVFGDVLADAFTEAAGEAGLEVVDERSLDGSSPARVAADALDANPDAVYYGGGAENGTPLLERLAQRDPDVALYGSDAFLLARDYPRRLRRVGADVRITSPALPAAGLPAEGRRFARDYAAEFDADPDAYAAYGYEAMAIVIDAVARAGGRGNDRAEVIDRFFETAERDSVLGRFSIEGDGDTTLDQIAGYRVSGGRAAFERSLTPP